MTRPLSLKRADTPARASVIAAARVQDTGDGTFAGYASLFGQADDQKDVVSPGAFASALDVYKRQPSTPDSGAASGPDQPFWETKQLADMTTSEWESLCDGCARCCLIKLEDEDTGDIETTNIVCHLLDQDLCRCTDYANRTKRVPTCIKLTPGNVAAIKWMPTSCAYRRLAEGRGLASWHPLVSGDPESVHLSGISVQGKVISEEGIPEDELEDYLAIWEDGDE